MLALARRWLRPQRAPWRLVPVLPPGGPERQVARPPPVRARDPALARRLAAGIWEDRAATFRVAYRRSPNLRELYLCWHRPGRVLAPKRRELARAERFAKCLIDLNAIAPLEDPNLHPWLIGVLFTLCRRFQQ